jgi:hypothetical protein
MRSGRKGKASNKPGCTAASCLKVIRRLRIFFEVKNSQDIETYGRGLQVIGKEMEVADPLITFSLNAD